MISITEFINTSTNIGYGRVSMSTLSLIKGSKTNGKDGHSAEQRQTPQYFQSMSLGDGYIRSTVYVRKKSCETSKHVKPI